MGDQQFSDLSMPLQASVSILVSVFHLRHLLSCQLRLASYLSDGNR